MHRIQKLYYICSMIRTKQYLSNLISEKANISMDTVIEVAGESGMNFIPLECIVEFILNLDKVNQRKCVSNLTAIDFKNGDVMHFFKYIGKYLAK